MKFIAYLRKRLNERSTWVAISAGIAAAATLPTPFSWIALGVGILGAIVPDGSVTNVSNTEN